MGIRKAVIPAAGLGTRLLPATKSQLKEMLPVGRKPTIQYVVEELEAAEVEQILIITGQKKRAIEDHFDRDTELIRSLSERGNYELIDALKHEEAGVQLLYTRQSEQLGTAHAISLAENFAHGEPFVVCLGDSIIKTEQPGSFLKRLIETHERRKASVTIAFQEVKREDVVRYGIAVPDPEHFQDSEFRLKGLITVKMGCGSWECRCTNPHSVPRKTEGKEGSTIVTLKPAPRGLGLASNDVLKKVLNMAGMKDVWGSTSGGSNTYNMAMAAVKALDALNTLKPSPE